MSDILTPKQAKQEVLNTLKGFLKKNEAAIKALLDREAKGMAKLQKSLKKDEGDFIPNLSKDAMPQTPAPAGDTCLECGGANLEQLGIHLGVPHYMCKDCSYDGATIREENEQQEQNQAADAAATQASMGKSESENAAMDRNSLSNMANKAKVRSSESRSNNIKTTANALRGELNPDSFSTGASQTHGKNAYKAEMPMAKPQTVENVRMSAGIAPVGTPKIPTVKKPSIPKTGGTKPQKDAFNTGGANNGVAKAEPSPAKPAKKPFNNGDGSNGVPSREVPDQEAGKPAARENTTPPPEAGGKETPADGSGGKVEKDKALEKGDFATMDAKAKGMAAPKSTSLIPAPKATAKAKVADIRARAAAKHGATRSQRAKDLKVMSALKPLFDKQKAAGEIPAKSAAIPLKPVSQGYKQVDQKAQSMGKAEGIPEAPKAPGAAATKAPAVKAPVASPIANPNKPAPKL